MLTKLKEIPVDSKEHIVDNDDLDTSFPTRGSRGFLPIEMLRNQNGERILLDKTETTIHEPLQLLNEYAQKHLFKIEFLDIVERSTCGLFQCLLRLHTLPVSVVHGQGATVQDSHVEAARNALQYLKIMATEKGLTNQWARISSHDDFIWLKLYAFIVVVVVTFNLWDEPSVTTSATTLELDLVTIHSSFY